MVQRMSIPLLFACSLIAASPRATPVSRPVETTAQCRVSIAHLACLRGMQMSTTPAGGLRLKDPLTDIQFDADSRQIRYNSVAIWLNEGVRKNGRDEWMISEADAHSVITALLDPGQAPDMDDSPVVLLDPGHGGEDSGTGNVRRYPEKRINLEVAIRVQKRLASCSITTLMTRHRDVAIDLGRRVQMAAISRPDCFVSIHMNSAANRSASGIESYVLTAPGFASTVSRTRAASPAGAASAGNEHNAANMLLAYDVHRGLLSQTGAADRGIRRARFEVLRDAICPAVLVECGFLSNTEESGRLTSAAYQDRLADGIAQGILTYVSRCQTQTARRTPPPPIDSEANVAESVLAGPGALKTASSEDRPQAPARSP